MCFCWLFFVFVCKTIESRTQLFLHQLGVCKYGRQAVESVKGGFWAADKYAQENYPEYYRKTIEFSQPYVQLSRDVGLVVYNQYVNLKEYVLGKYPIVLETVSLKKLIWNQF